MVRLQLGWMFQNTSNVQTSISSGSDDDELLPTNISCDRFIHQNRNNRSRRDAMLETALKTGIIRFPMV